MSAEQVQKKCGADCECASCSQGGGEGAGEQVQMKATQSPLMGDEVHSVAGEAFSEGTSEVPHRARMEQAFGTDLGHLQAAVGTSAASDANEALGAEAFAMGSNRLAFKSADPSPGLVAHEITHNFQQTGGIQLKGGVGQKGDVYEQEADAVAATVSSGGSASHIVQKYGKGSATSAVQASMVQFGLRDWANRAKRGITNAGRSVYNAGRDVYNAGRRAVDAVMRWVDLLGPKRDLVNRMRDGSWAANALTGLNTDAHPKHKFRLDLAIWALMVKARLETFQFGGRIVTINDLKSLQALEKEFIAWRDKRGKTLKAELEDKVKEYTQVEKQWLASYAKHAPISKDNLSPNKSSQKVRLTFKPGKPNAVVTLETRVKYNFIQSSQAQKLKLAPMSGKKKTWFHGKFQDQVKRVWNTPKGGKQPFRLSAPADHLLVAEPERWSQMTASFKGQVTKTAGKAHFVVDVTQLAPGEPGRASVGTGTGNFFWGNATAGYKADGTASGAQYTLAHEWMHMIGNPDEYAENISSQSGRAAKKGSNFSSTYRKDYAQRWPNCKKHFTNIIGAQKKIIADQQKVINDPKSTAAQKTAAQAKVTKAQATQKKAKSDLSNMVRFYDTDAKGNRNYFKLANRPDIPDICFAVRGYYDKKFSRYLRPGAKSQRGGTRISMSKDDEKRLSDAGNEVRPYIREGIVEQLRVVLKGQFDPEVSFDHNFKDMSKKDLSDVAQVRVMNVFSDLKVKMGLAKAPVGSEVNTGDIDHDHSHDHDHDH